MVVFQEGKEKNKKETIGGREEREREREREKDVFITFFFCSFILYLNMAPRPAAITADFNSSTAASRERTSRGSMRLPINSRFSEKGRRRLVITLRLVSRFDVCASFPSRRRMVDDSRIEG